jgi:hypothetical protein
MNTAEKIERLIELSYYLTIAIKQASPEVIDTYRNEMNNLIDEILILKQSKAA